MTTFSTRYGMVPVKGASEHTFTYRISPADLPLTPSVTNGLNLQESTVECKKKAFSQKCVIRYELSVSLYLSRACGFC